MRHLFTLILAAGLASLVSAADKPNFIVINIDDLGYADIGPFGSTLNRTPNLDRMAAEGRKLTSHYAAPVCSPSRSALMTGCYPKRVLPIPSVLFPASEVGLNPEEMTVAEVLKTRGYATGCIGKWHLGDQPGMLPNDQGFDYYYGIPYSNDMGTRAEGSKSNPGEEPKQPAAPKNPAKKKAPQANDETGLRGDTQPPLPLLENHTVIERVKQNGQTTITQRYTAKAVGFIREHREGPFFLYLPHTAVHFPLYPGMEYRGKSKNGLIGDWVEEVDWSVGQVLDAVRELGLSENTLVVFTSDNGGTTRSVNTPLRGNKGSTLEGGIRVCTIAWWPGKIPAGTATDAMTSMMDILPTFAGLAGAEVPSDRKIDGVDIWPVMTGDARPREVFHYFRGLKLEAVRKGPWKLHLENGELYNLDSDIGEATNVAEANPDRVKELRSFADGMTDDLGLTEVGKGCRPMERYPNPLPLISHDGTIRAGFEPKP
ncbi:MAG: sulfatase [Verrucomicrobiae bacterium]|nr:sulfatase [Verrucomicrobiae bacterium]